MPKLSFKRPWGLLSNTLFRAAEFADAWVGLPSKVSDSLHFRQDWRNFFPSRRPDDPTLWIHGASVGEIEDLAALFSEPSALKLMGYPLHRIVITASSISARERLENWRHRGFAYCGPLPPESVREIKAFLYLLKPELMVLSHSDIWPVAFEEAKRSLKKGCLWLPSRIPSSRTLMNDELGNFVQTIGCRSVAELDHFRESPLPGTPDLVWIGNPRVDRILSRIRGAQPQLTHALDEWGCRPDKGRISWILGSCWLEDAQIVAGALGRLTAQEVARFQIVVIPHETKDAHLVAAIQSILPMARVLTVQGVLAEAYRDFDLALVGGGFKTGLHNVLEPTLWEVPAIVGPLLRQQPEAPALQKIGQLHVVSSIDTLALFLKKLLNAQELSAFKAKSKLAARELRAHEGATLRLAELIRKKSQ